MARKKNSRLRLRLIGVLLLVLLAGGGWAWWHLTGWTPPRAEFPVQGIEVGGEDGPVDWTALKTIGADFVYLDASASAFARDPKFVDNLEGAKAAGLQWGAVHRYDPCQPADKQAANFVTVVPRDNAMLPAAVWLDQLADDVISIPYVEEYLQPLVCSIPLQLLSYEIALLRGCNVDRPRNLAKSVTVE